MASPGWMSGGRPSAEGQTGNASPDGRGVALGAPGDGTGHGPVGDSGEGFRGGPSDPTDGLWSGAGGGAGGGAGPGSGGGDGAWWDNGLPERIGRYRVYALIGRGGMGRVYDAVQDGTGLRVALKVMDDGLNESPQARDRFDAEARILARLRHPNIARIHEAGLCRLSGREMSFIAMELIRGGETLTNYAESRQLSVRARVELMLPVVRAMQHAHSKPVVHRDLKPSNILVDEDGQPKVIDFGVARLDEGDAPRTQFGQVIGTHAYMAPEQRTGDPSEVDVRCDVFSLGVVLHELLSGSRPTPNDRPMPRSRSGDRSGMAWVPVNRIDPRIDADLSVVVAKAIEPDPDRRFQTAAQLGEQLERWLEGRPLTIGRVSGWLRARKFVRRHRVSTALVGIAGSVVAMLLVLALYNGVKAERALRESEAVAGFLLDDVLGSLNPETPDGAALTVRDLLELTSSHVSERFADRPEMAGRIRLSLGRAFFALREIGAAQREAALCIEHFGERPGNLADMLGARHLQAVLWVQTQEPERALPVLRSLVPEYAQLYGPDSAELVELYQNIAWCHMSVRNYPATIDVLRVAMDLARRKADERPLVLIHTESLLGDVLIKTAEYEQALGLLDEAARSLSMIRQDVRADRARIQTFRADALANLGRHAEAEQAAREALGLREQLFEPEHPIVCASRVYLGKVLSETGRADESMPLFESALRVYERTMAADGLPHRHALSTRVHLARALARTGSFERATVEATRVLEALERRGLSAADEMMLSARIVLCEALLAMERWEDAMGERARLDMSRLPAHHTFHRYVRDVDERLEHAAGVSANHD